MAQIRDCADRLSHLTSQLLVLAKSEPIKGGSELEPVDLHALSREICMEWAPFALQRQMELAFDGPGHPVLVAGDATLLRELLGNLLDNAIRYGFERGNVSVALQERPQPKLTVSDDGPGIPDGEIGRVFERFYRLGPGTGCGLGLAIVKEIADLHRA
ncbi:sensor histidine kinase, partial [Methylomonas koyamae]|uniref:sensor histidine kinase n=1 Tax=Methylomonas koyamae TaxID=702114 RepID=UPI00210FE7F3